MGRGCREQWRLPACVAAAVRWGVPVQWDSGCCYVSSCCHAPEIPEKQLPLNWRILDGIICLGASFRERDSFIIRVQPLISWLCHRFSRRHYRPCIYTQIPADEMPSPGSAAQCEPGCSSHACCSLQPHGPLLVWLCTEVKA